MAVLVGNWFWPAIKAPPTTIKQRPWATGIDVDENGVVFTLFTDAYNNTRYDATLKFPFTKGSAPTTNGVLSAVSEVFDIQPADDTKQQQTAAGGQVPQGNVQPPPQAQNQPATPPTPPPAPSGTEQVVAPLAPPPPPPPDPVSVSLGQTPDQVVSALGQPTKMVKLGAKQIYIYKDMKVTFVNNKVTDVQ